MAGFARFQGHLGVSVFEHLSASCAAQRNIREVPFPDIRACLSSKLDSKCGKKALAGFGVEVALRLYCS
jgi:hypothetical protein